MNNKLQQLLDNNQQWAKNVELETPGFFEKLSKQQTPEYLWIGCSDSRVPANQIVGLMPGEVFVHRNIANQVIHTDLNCLSVIQFAVDVLKVKHVIVCGHYGCGGIDAAMQEKPCGLIDNWLRHIQDTQFKFRRQLGEINKIEQLDRMCEFNVVQQVLNVARTTIVMDAWERNQELTIHGWIYGLTDGLVKDQQVTIASTAEAESLAIRFDI
ncbi:carbonate dehydratase [Saccharobesus litoralis]|uniref:Carbonic anhydrase n=1 Tax=Saccharobesus litoralis TaxID=2172099 RepID=A0A2S0VWP8_9ALTE|nr:carbonate dehydratase [Saccharobesus litoralis]AWB68603.1 carbonate dehydratase [Saccharobesus litoralis]